MEERTNAELGTTSSPLGATAPVSETAGGAGTGLETLESTERGDTGFKEQATEKARRYGEQAKKLGGKAREQVVKQADTRKSWLTSQLDELAGSLEELGRTLEQRGNDQQKKLADRGALYVRKASRMLREKSSDELLDRAQSELKSRPAAAIAGATLLGFLGIRMLKS